MRPSISTQQFGSKARVFTLMFVFCVLAICCKPACAVPPWNVDNPTTATHNHIVIDVDSVSSQIKGFNAESWPTLNIALGATDKLELDLNLNEASVFTTVSGNTNPSFFGYHPLGRSFQKHTSVGQFDAGTTSSYRETGFGDTYLGYKYRFIEETKNRPQIGYTFNWKIPTADPIKGLGTGKADYAINLVSCKSWGKYQLSGNLGYNLLGTEAQKNNTFYGTVLTYQVSEPANIGFQVYGNTPNAPGVHQELAIGTGIAYGYAPGQTFELSIGKSTEGFSDLNVYCGLDLDFDTKTESKS